MKEGVLVGIDIGSTNIKTVIFDKRFNILANEALEIKILYPNPGWTEYDPSDWWNLLKQTLQNAMRKAMVVPKDIRGIGVSSLGCCTVPLDVDGNHTYNSIPWHDHRAMKEVAFLEKNCSQRIFDACGNIPTVLSATPHLMWLKENRPDEYAKMHKYTEASGFIVQKLTGEFVLDYSMASALDYGMDIGKLAYDERLINEMRLDLSKFPRLHDNQRKVGGVSRKAGQETGLAEGTPVYLGGLDIVTAAISAGVMTPGQAFYSMGSASNLMIVSDVNRKSRNLTSIVNPMNSQLKYLLGSQATVGFSLKWFSEQLCGQERIAAQFLNNELGIFDIITGEAGRTRAGSGGVMYFPYLFGKFHPVFNADSSGVFFGLNTTTTKAQMIRSVLEGCTYNMYESIKSASDIGIRVEEIIAGGGPTKSDLWCQIIADVTGSTLKTINIAETTPLGSAILAGIGEGLYSGMEEIVGKYIRYDRVFTANSKNHESYQGIFGLYEKIYKDLLPSFKEHSELQARLTQLGGN